MTALRDAIDFTTLGWVKPELDETLRQARIEVEAYAEDPSDASRMRLCANYLHQVQGTLRMVELYAPAMVAEEMEGVAVALQEDGVADRDGACAALMRGVVLLPDYLERLQSGHKDIPIVLLPLLNELRAARGAAGINENVLLGMGVAGDVSEAELEHARGSVSGRNRALLDTVSGAVKEDLMKVKDALDLYLRGDRADTAGLQPQVEALGRVADTLGMLGLGIARGVVQQQRDAMAQMVRGDHAADEDALLDVAGALLYVDATLDDQVARLGEGDASGTEDPLAGESRKVVDVLVREAIANFADARQAFVAFVETSWDHAELVEVPRLLEEVSGALRMLELPEPADYLVGVRRYSETELIGRKRVPNGRQLDTLADALASLEYYIEGLRDQRGKREDILAIARTSLEYLGYWPLPALPHDMQAGVPQDDAQADIGEAPGLVVEEAVAAFVHRDVPPPVEAPAAAATPSQSHIAPGGFEATGDEIDDEIREVFLEEFEEEIGNLDVQLPAWRADPENLELLRPIRRVFHTLKGSGRLVGAKVLGEFSWKIENMLNRVLDGTRAASPAVVAMVDRAFYTLPQLHDALRGQGAPTADLERMQVTADRIAAGEEIAFEPEPAATPQPGVPDEQSIAPPSAIQAEGIPASVDSVLLEILEAEVAGHLSTVGAWLAAAAGGGVLADDALVRAVHTMNGAFAMTEVPAITEAITPAEGYVKRLVAAGQPASTEGVAAIGDLADAIRETVAGLRAPRPMVLPREALAERLRTLRDSLPEVPSQEAMSIPDAIDADVPELVAQDLSAYGDLAAEAGVAETEARLLDAERQAFEDAERERMEAERLAAEQAELERAEAERLAAEQAELERAEAERLAAEQAELERAETERLAAEQVELERAEAERLAAEQAELERAEAERLAAEHAERERVEAERLAAQLKAEEEEEYARLEAEYAEQARLAQLQVESERLAAEEAERERIEAERVLAEQAERERIEHERQVAEQAERDRMEAERLLAEQIEQEREQAARLAAEEAEQARQDAEALASQPPAADADAQPPAATEVVPVDAQPSGVVASVLAQTAATADDPDEALDLSGLDPELVDIFVEESSDLLDHSDGLLAQLRETPNEREPLVGLQRDLHTIKGGARMAGIMAIGELGHAMESLLEAVVDQRSELGRDGIPLLERGFDRLHAMVTRVGARRAIALPEALIEDFDNRARGFDTDTRQMPATAVPAPKVELKPLSAPISADAGVDDDDVGVRAPQEQVRIRADLLDRLVNYAGEVAIYRARLEQQLGAFRSAMAEMEQTNARLRDQLRRLDSETEAQIIARYQREQDTSDGTFDPLELDRFSTLQQLSRALAESAADMSSLQGTLDDLTRQYETLLLQQSRVSSDLQEGLMRTRMVPFDALVPRLRRVVRQAASDTGKQVQLKLDGAQGELDRNVLERMTAPLEHMLRNAVAHGLESPDDRARAGKPAEGVVRIAVRREGSEVVLEVGDDGTGLDRGAIRRRAEERGLVRGDAVLADSDLDALIMEPGFSTATEVSRLAGRGVGMDVVASEVRQLGGALDIASRKGEGTLFTLRLPQTLAVTQAVFVRIGETSFAVPIASVRGVGRISREEFVQPDAKYAYGGEDYALHDLGTLLGTGAAKADGQLQIPLLLIRSGELRAAVAIDQVVGNREIVVKPVGPQVASVPGIFGATIMGDGRVVVILDVAPLVRRQATMPRDAAPAPQPEPRHAVPLVMVVDDSVTMRKVTGRVLERHNFEVATAKDGIDALERMDERVPDLMLLDIEMPRMDGYELATQMRSDPRLRGVPIIMITSRTGEKHRQRAFEIGVQRYLGKPYQEQELMRNVFDLLAMEQADD